MIRKKTIYHEEHEDHEGFCELSPFGDIPANPESYNRMMLDARLQGHSCLSKPGFILLRGLRVLRGSNEVSA
jgi:hypothetical protein